MNGNISFDETNGNKKNAIMFMSDHFFIRNMICQAGDNPYPVRSIITHLSPLCQLTNWTHYFTYVDLVPWPGFIVHWTNRALVIFQVSSGLIGRVTHVDHSFNREMELSPRVSSEFELTLDHKSVLHAIDTMNFSKWKVPRHWFQSFLIFCGSGGRSWLTMSTKVSRVQWSVRVECCRMDQMDLLVLCMVISSCSKDRVALFTLINWCAKKMSLHWRTR